jgi:hypothetical protein
VLSEKFRTLLRSPDGPAANWACDRRAKEAAANLQRDSQAAWSCLVHWERLMDTSRLGWLLAGAVAGCAGRVHPGLANAPDLGGASAESRVHDVVANGRDACQRGAFAPGEVLRGQVPPCKTQSSVTEAPAAFVSPPSEDRKWIPASYPLGVCPPRQGLGRMTARAENTSGVTEAELACDSGW